MSLLVRPRVKDKLSSYEKLLAKADIQSLYNRRLRDIAVFMYKIKHKLLLYGYAHICICYASSLPVMRAGTSCFSRVAMLYKHLC